MDFDEWFIKSRPFYSSVEHSLTYDTEPDMWMDVEVSHSRGTRTLSSQSFLAFISKLCNRCLIMLGDSV